MNDSCKPRKLDAGFATMCSKPSVFSTSTMKSEPGFATVIELLSAASEALSAASACAACDGDNGALAPDPTAGSCPVTGSTGAVNAAAAAPRRNLRRSTRGSDLAIEHLLSSRTDFMPRAPLLPNRAVRPRRREIDTTHPRWSDDRSCRY